MWITQNKSKSCIRQFHQHFWCWNLFASTKGLFPLGDMCDLFSVFTCWRVTAVSVFTRWCVTDWCVHSLVCYLFFLCKWTERTVINEGWSIIEGTVSASPHSKVKGQTNISDMDPWTPPAAFLIESTILLYKCNKQSSIFLWVYKNWACFKIKIGGLQYYVQDDTWWHICLFFTFCNI